MFVHISCNYKYFSSRLLWHHRWIQQWGQMWKHMQVSFRSNLIGVSKENIVLLSVICICTVNGSCRRNLGLFLIDAYIYQLTDAYCVHVKVRNMKSTADDECTHATRSFDIFDLHHLNATLWMYKQTSGSLFTSRTEQHYCVEALYLETY